MSGTAGGAPIWSGGWAASPGGPGAGLGDRRTALDGLRALAVTAVLYSHLWMQDTQLGHLGVRLFFVLSGFLITGVLLDLRGRPGAYRAFLARRALRLLPAYLVLLAVLVAVDVQGIRQDAGWHLLQASNLLVAWRGDYEPWVAAHYWSLSIEEQFYLLWPLGILLLPPRVLRPLVLATIAAGLLWRTGALWADLPRLARIHLPLAASDALGKGALLALRRQGGSVPRGLSTGGLLAGALMLLLLLSHPWSDRVELIRCLLETLALPAFAALVVLAARPDPGPFLAPLALRPLVAMGRISYGLYLYHLAVLALVWDVTERMGWPFLLHGPALFALGLVLTALVAAASRVLLERPFLLLKDRVPYRRTTAG